MSTPSTPRGQCPNAPQKPNSKIDDIDRNKAYACKRCLSFNK